VVKRRTGAAHAIWEMDLYPDVAVQLGVMRAQSILTRSLGRLLDGIRHRADIVIVLGECMREKVLAHGVRPERIRTVENWAHELARPSPRPDCAARLTIVSAGNFGLAHDTGTLKTILLELGSDADMQFVFIGGGKGLEDLESFCKNERIGCASFHPYLPEPEFSRAMARADIGLVTQNNATLGSVVPSKLYGLLSAGIPVLYIGPGRSTSAVVLRDNECGWQFDPGDAAGAIALLRNCRKHRDLAHRAGVHARELYLKSYTVAAGLALRQAR
jgi:glycosyltransferase involved in cell wall biosynthesis